ncbi:MAG: zinc ribbon domain-containing protein [Pseudomonadota bacterium]
MFACFLLAVLLGGLVGAAGNPGFARMLLGGLLATVLFFSGIHAAGVLLMDQARGVQLRSVTDAFTYALLCVPKTIGLIIVLGLAVLAVNLLIALLFYLSKVPVLGVLLFAVVFPLSVLSAGLTTAAVFIGFQMALAAMWDGAPLSAAITRAAAILRYRLVESVLLLAVVFVIGGIVMGLVAFVLFFGFWPATAIAAGIVGGFNLGGFNSIAGTMLSGSASGYALAGAIGTGFLWALGATLVFQVGLLGVNLVYLRVGDGLDAGAMQSAVLASLAQARTLAAEMGEKAKDAAERARLHAQEAAARRRQEQPQPILAQPALTTPSAECPACNALITEADLFCGNCGHKLH